MSCDTWYEPHLFLASQSWNRILWKLYFIGWNHSPMLQGRNQSTRKEPPTTSFRKCHVLQPENSSPSRESIPLSSTGVRRWLGKLTRCPLMVWCHCVPEPLIFCMWISFLLFLLLRSQLYLWGSQFWVTFFCECFFVCFFFFHPTVEVVTISLRGWCILGVLLLPAFTRLGH